MKAYLRKTSKSRMFPRILFKKCGDHVVNEWNCVRFVTTTIDSTDRAITSKGAEFAMLCRNERIAGLNSGEVSYGTVAGDIQVSERSFEFKNRLTGNPVAIATLKVQ
jgi:hypothetical protein